MVKKAQYRIQQMVFMIVAVSFFFILVGVFFLGYQYRTTKSSFEDLQKEQAISFLNVIRNMPEFGYSSKDSYAKGICLDLDKIAIVSSEVNKFSELFPVASIELAIGFKPKRVPCPGNECNYYDVYSSGQEGLIKYDSFVCICKKVSENSYSYDKCELGKLIIGVKE